jgi:hypothetical protein
MVIHGTLKKWEAWTRRCSTGVNARVDARRTYMRAIKSCFCFSIAEMQDCMAVFDKRHTAPTPGAQHDRIKKFRIAVKNNELFSKLMEHPATKDLYTMESLLEDAKHRISRMQYSQRVAMKRHKDKSRKKDAKGQTSSERKPSKAALKKVVIAPRECTARHSASRHLHERENQR